MAAGRVVKEAEVRRTEIVAAATKLFATKGYEKTTVGDILRSVQIAKGGFYHHFASKADVFAACVDILTTRLMAHYIELLRDEKRTPAERVRAYVRVGYTHGELADLSRLVDELHAHGGNELHAQVLDRVQEQIIPVFAQAIAAGRDEGMYSFEGAPRVVAVAVLGMLRALHERYAHEPDSAELVPYGLTIAIVERALGIVEGNEQ